MSGSNSSASRRCCSTPHSAEQDLKPASPWRRRPGSSRSLRICNGKAERSRRKCPLVVAARRALEVVGLGPLGVDIALRLQFRHRRFGRASAFRSSAARSARSGRSGDPRHRRRHEQLGFSHPGGGGWDPSRLQFARPLTRKETNFSSNACFHPPGKIDQLADRDLSIARMAVLSALQEDGRGRRLSRRSIIVLRFRLPDRPPSKSGGRPAIVPDQFGRRICGRQSGISGAGRFRGLRLRRSDTWAARWEAI